MTQSERLEKLMRDYQWQHNEIPLTEYLLRHGVAVLPCVAYSTHEKNFRVIKKNSRSERVFFTKAYRTREEAEQRLKEEEV